MFKPTHLSLINITDLTAHEDQAYIDRTWPDADASLRCGVAPADVLALPICGVRLIRPAFVFVEKWHIQWEHERVCSAFRLSTSFV